MAYCAEKAAFKSIGRKPWMVPNSILSDTPHFVWMFLRLKSLKFDFKYQYSHHASTFQILNSLQENPSRRPCHRRASASSMQIANHSLLDSITTIRNEGELANVRRLLEEARHHQHFTGACFCQQLAADRERESRGLSRARSGTCGCTKE